MSRERNIAVAFVAHDINPLLGALDRVLYLAGGGSVSGAVDEVIQSDVLTALYGFPVTVVLAQGARPRGRRRVKETSAMPDPLTYEFMRNAYMIGAIVAIIAAAVGYFGAARDCHSRRTGSRTSDSLELPALY